MRDSEENTRVSAAGTLSSCFPLSKQEGLESGKVEEQRQCVGGGNINFTPVWGSHTLLCLILDRLISLFVLMRLHL